MNQMIADHFDVIDTATKRKHTWHLVEVTVTEFRSFTEADFHRGSACFEVECKPDFNEKMKAQYREIHDEEPPAWFDNNTTFIKAYFLSDKEKRKDRCRELIREFYVNPGKPVRLWIIEMHGAFFIQR